MAAGPAASNKNRADFTQAGGLAPYSAFTIAVALPPGSVTASGPILEQRWSLRRALTPTPLTGALSAAIIVLGVRAVSYLVATRGRDLRYAGQTPGLLPAAGTPETEQAMPLMSRTPVAVAFTPPPGLRPGQIGIFSRYLPYAIVFGDAERWTKVFLVAPACRKMITVP